MITITSLINTSAQVSIDPYAINPLADDYAAVNPARYTDAVRYGGPPPRMFDDGTRDLPAATASGVDPYFLGWLPYGVRHYAADLPTEEQVHALFERHSGDPRARYDHAGFDDAVARLQAWATAEKTDTAAAVTASAAARSPRAKLPQPAGSGRHV